MKDSFVKTGGIEVVWEEDLPDCEWDMLLAMLGGHPLQSAQWGGARREFDKATDRRWVCLRGDTPILMIRFEIRTLAVGRVAWVPRGPTWGADGYTPSVHNEFLERLRKTGIMLCIEDQYFAPGTSPKSISLVPKPRTVFVDLARGKDDLWSGLDKQWRYGVRSAARAGVVVEETTDPTDVCTFFSLCTEISQNKSFELRGSAELLMALLQSCSVGVSCHLFVARFQNRMAGGAFIIRSGQRIHYFWGATDRAYSKQRPGEAIHWRVIEWGMENGITSYDLEGVDPENNPGVYRFKLKMGGLEMELPGKEAFPLSLLGRLTLNVGRMFKKV